MMDRNLFFLPLFCVVFLHYVDLIWKSLVRPCPFFWQLLELLYKKSKLNSSRFMGFLTSWSQVERCIIWEYKLYLKRKPWLTLEKYGRLKNMTGQGVSESCHWQRCLFKLHYAYYLKVYLIDERMGIFFVSDSNHFMMIIGMACPL